MCLSYVPNKFSFSFYTRMALANIFLAVKHEKISAAIGASVATQQPWHLAAERKVAGLIPGLCGHISIRAQGWNVHVKKKFAAC